LIELKQVSKSYGKLQALKEISFSIQKGELFGLLGPNGAGKSTTINLLSTLIPYDKGSILINGNDIRQNARKIKQVLGVIPQEIALYEDLTAYENLQFWGKIYGISGKELSSRCNELLEMVGLYERRNATIKTFSGGMKRRINIAAGLLHNPSIILMDEPTVGVDPQSRNFIFDLIKQLHSIGKTIVYTTHYMEEAEKLCQRIAIIDHGKLLALNTLAELLKMLGNEETVSIQFAKPVKLETLQAYFPDILLKEDTDRTIHFTGKNLHQKLWKFLTIFHELSIEYSNIKLHQPNLEKLFLKLTGRALRE
jgi:ABC-2 type transport system ATP-binding protein